MVQHNHIVTEQQITDTHKYSIETAVLFFLNYYFAR